MTEEDHPLNKRASARKAKAMELARFKDTVYETLKADGPCTARALANKLGDSTRTEVRVRAVSNSLAVLKRQGMAEVVSSHNDVKTWDVKR